MGTILLKLLMYTYRFVVSTFFRNKREASFNDPFFETNKAVVTLVLLTSIMLNALCISKLISDTRQLLYIRENHIKIYIESKELLDRKSITNEILTEAIKTTVKGIK